MTKAELAGYDGRNGQRAYIAVNGTVYDVTASSRWENGLHPSVPGESSLRAPTL